MEKGVKKLKVPYYASAAAVRDGNLPYVKATCLILRQLASNNGHLPLFLTFILVLKEFSALKDNKLNKTKFFIKLKKALVLKTPLIFNRCVLI